MGKKSYEKNNFCSYYAVVEHHFASAKYLFYHDGIPSGGNGFRRTTAFREFQRMKDGRIPKINIEAK